MCERDMVVSNVVEKMDFTFVKKETGSNRVNWRIAPPFIEETAIFVK